jgi:hypothetical protein
MIEMQRLTLPLESSGARQLRIRPVYARLLLPFVMIVIAVD